MKSLITITTFTLSIYINAQNSKNDTVDPFSSQDDNNHPSWVGEKVKINDHYVIQKDGSYIRKDIYEKQQNNTPFLVGGSIILIGIIGFFIGNKNKLKKITGYEPIKTINLGTYNRQEKLDIDNYDKLLDRDYTKTKIIMNYFETDSIKVLFDFANGEKMVFDAIEIPYINGDEVKVSLSGENRQPAYLYKDFQQLTLINPVSRIKIVFKY